MPRTLPIAVVLSILFVACLTAASASPIVNDITQINPIEVDRIAIPKTVEDVRELVRSHRGAISIGGGHFSMGGQTASEHTLHLDMRSLNRIVSFSPKNKTITVEAGITWRTIQETIDPHDLSLKIMQTYSNFTVGGSLSVNAHGRYVGQGPLIGSVKSIKVVLADGQLLEATPTQRPDLFFGCIGGYGGLGVIVEATLDLTDNVKVERVVERMPVTVYQKYFTEKITSSKTAIFHNGDLYPPDYDHVAAITWQTTDKPVTIADRLMPIRSHERFNKLAYFWITEMPFGKQLRQHLVDPVRLHGDVVVWRNYEASRDVGALEPPSRDSSTFVLQEYFVPLQQFNKFVTKMGDIFKRHHANIVNVSIRHAMPDHGSLLAWAREEVFSFVIYYKQGTSQQEKTTVGIWTRELIDAALLVGGSYYLPYQLHATKQQFHQAYPRAEEFFALKQQIDPTNRFHNKLWDKYYHKP
jgi:FAD/FMN-containing dehydrogenase